MIPQITEAYKLGYDCGQKYYADDNFDAYVNPYKKETEDWCNWNIGWNNGLGNEMDKELNKQPRPVGLDQTQGEVR
jgi:hypothetical protein